VLAIDGDAVVLAPAARRTGDLMPLNASVLGGQTASVFGQVCEACLLAPEHVELFLDGAPLYQLDGFAGDLLPALPVPPGAATYRYERRVQLDPAIVSFDDGQSWHPAPVIPLGDQALAIIAHPPGAQRSLRGSATDRAGSQVEQTIIRAYPVTP
jgi:hypothetical protein